MPDISVVIPAYNSEASIQPLVQELDPLLSKIADNYEIIIVEDDSTDNTWEVVEGITQQNDHVRGFKLMRNFGQHNALLCGIRAAQFEIIVTMDDDQQHPPGEIPKLLEKLTDGFDVVYGTPQKEQHGIWRDLASQVTKLVLQGAMGAETARNISAFRVFRTHLRDAFVDYRSPYVNIDVLLTWATRRFTAIPVQHVPRAVGKSNYTLRKLIAHTFNMVTGFSNVPLRLASLLGFGLTLFGLVLLVYIIIIRIVIFNYDVPGFTFLASIISIFAGAQMFVLGIMGEYLARIHFRTMDRPPYVIRETENQKDETTLTKSS